RLPSLQPSLQRRFLYTCYLFPERVIGAGYYCSKAFSPGPGQETCKQQLVILFMPADVPDISFWQAAQRHSLWPAAFTYLYYSISEGNIIVLMRLLWIAVYYIQLAAIEKRALCFHYRFAIIGGGKGKLVYSI